MIVDTNKLQECIEEAKGSIDYVYLHWTAGRYGQFFDDYHICIDGNGRIYMPDEDLSIKRNHTYNRNTGAVGIALCCCYKAEANNGYDADFGDYPPTQAQIEAMAVVCALFNIYGGIPIERMLTHCEVAFFDGYGPFQGDPDLRWDLWFLPDSGEGGQMRGGGDVIRGKARWYVQNW